MHLADVAYLALFAAVALILQTIYLSLKGPLSHLPGPWISRVTNLRLQYAVLTGQRVVYVDALHRKYGRTVRISPTESSLSDAASAKILYKIGGPFLKSPWYSAFAPPFEKYQSIFTIIDPKEHGQHRRLSSAHFSDSWVARMEPYVARNVHLAVQKMREEVGKLGYCDTYKWFTFMATDIIGEMSFGASFKMLEIGKKDQYIHDLETVGFRGAMYAEFPQLMRLLNLLPIGFANETVQILDRLRIYSRLSVERYWRLYKADPDNVKPTLLTKEYAMFENGSLDMGQLERDASTYIIAGTDTTALTLMYTTWMLAHHPDSERRLIRELSTLPPDYTDEDLRRLPFLESVYHESLRLRAPVAQGLPRTIPDGGAEFGGYYLPQGSTVGVQQYTLGRDPNIFPDPDTFDPSRWESTTKEMRDSWLPFGGGSRVCIGQHFAQLELRLALAAFYRTFEKGMVPSLGSEGFTADDVTPMSFFLCPPKGKRCFLKRRV